MSSFHKWWRVTRSKRTTFTLTLTLSGVIQKYDNGIVFKAIHSTLSCSILAQRCCQVLCHAVGYWQRYVLVCNKSVTVRGIPCHYEMRWLCLVSDGVPCKSEPSCFDDVRAFVNHSLVIFVKPLLNSLWMKVALIK